MNSLVYQCPYCAASVEVPPDMIEETVACPNEACERPFRLQTPPGRILTSQNGEEIHGDYRLEKSNYAEEQTKVVTRPAMFRNRPFSFIGLVIAIAGGLIGAIVTWTAGLPGWTIALVLVALVAGGMMAYWWLQVHFTMLTITSKRSILRWGIVSKSTSEVPHEDVGNIRIDKHNLLDRILDCGDIGISSAAQSGIEIDVNGIPKPEKIVGVIREQQAQLH